MTALAQFVERFASALASLASTINNKARPTIGDTKCWFLDTPPPGWVFMHGQVLNTADYPEAGNLFKAKYGGNGTSTFGLPDTRGRMLVGAGGGVTLGQTGGHSLVTLGASNLPAHTHDVGTIQANTAVTLNGAAQGSTPTTAPTTTNKYLGSSVTGNAQAAAIWSTDTATPVTMGGVNTTMSGATGSAGSATPDAVDVTNPFLGTGMIICLVGNLPN